MAGVSFSPRKRKNCKVNCSVFNCNSSAQKHPNIRFYQFPKENASPVMVRNLFGVLEQSNKLQCWIKALRIIGKTVTSSMRVCSLHFKDVRSLRVNIDRALIFGYDLHEHFMQLILKFGQYLQHSLFTT